MLLEVQGLRGLAIIAVLLFHLWPNAFPNGYVGVDMFFVISGYLMALIFSRKPSLNIKTIADFYYKRGKRILPLYYLAVPLILLAGHLFLTPGWIDANNSFGLYSLAILKNMKTIWDGSNYFLAFQATVHQKDIFLHLWSLAVEMQFYLIVPFIVIGLRILRMTILKIAFLLILSAATCAQYYYSNPIFSFNYFLSRMWQFCPGMIAFLATENKSTEIGKEKQDEPRWYVVGKETAAFFAIVPMIMMVLPQEIPDQIMRPATTLSCFLFLLVGTELTKKFLTQKWLTYCGDISYSLYLVHWPIILLFRNSHSIQFITCVIAFLAVLSYTYYENFYRKLSIPGVFMLLACLAAFNALVFLTLMKCPYIIGKLEKFRYPNIDSEESTALRINLEFSQQKGGSQYGALTPHAIYNSSSSSFHPQFSGIWGIYDYPDGNGTQKVMLIGNSYVLNQANTIHKEFHGNYSKFKIITGLGLMVLYDNWDPLSPFGGLHEKALQLVEDFKPDLLFIITRYDQNMKEPLTSLDDPYLPIYRANIGRLEKVAEKILFTGPLPYVPLLHLNSFISTIVENGDLTRYHINRQKADAEMHAVVPRLEAINCSKCQIYDVKSEFLDGGRYLTYDPRTNVSFFDNDIHLTLVGLERIRPAFTKLIAQL